MRIGIVQPMIGIVGGQDKALFSLLDVLKNTEHEVEVLTCSKPMVHVPVKVHTRIPVKIKMFGLYQKILQFNNKYRFHEYDLIISTTGGIVHSDKPVIYYDQNNNLNLTLSRPPKYEKGIWKMYYTPYEKSLTKGVEQIKEGSNVRFITNSHYVRENLTSQIDSNIRVIYPPVKLSELRNNPSKPIDVIMVGRYSPEKRLVFAVEVLNRLVNNPVMFGNAIKSTQGYLKKLQGIANDNIEFRVNESRKSLIECLSKSKVLFHCGRETFGIAVVEGIASGCIPIVPDNSAHRETVPFDDLRYDPDDIEEARHKIVKAINGDYDHLLTGLMSHIKQFDESVFQEKMMKVIEEELITV